MKLQLFFLLLNALIGINNSVLYLLSVHLQFDFKELLTICCCLSSISNFYTIYKLVTIQKEDIKQYILYDEDQNELYLPYSNSNLIFSHPTQQED
jgi:hypothetical protein